MRVQSAGRTHIMVSRTVLFAVAICVSGTTASAGTEGATVVHGAATFQQNGNYTTIQASDKAIINYRSFDIARPETVEFIQPSASASVMNRILSANPTTIDGTLLANGRVFFVNPAGVIFGESAQVNVAQLVASALNINNADFINGRYDFKGGQGDVINRGSISAEQVALIGKRVANLGKIDCPSGVVVLVAGDRVFLGEPGTDLLVETDPSTFSEDADPVEGSAVLNEGSVEVGNGSIVLAAAGDVYSRAIANVGKLSASTADGDGGVVKLAAPDGTVINTGSIAATSESGKGGNVQVMGDRVGLLEDSEIDVSGASGGGSALIGGDYRGQGEIPTASRTVVGPDAAIRADATEDGDGGKIIVWSDEVTKFYGHASAVGAGNGDGGLIEVSGKQDLSFAGTVALGSPGGQGGTLLLDPAAITITDGGQDGSPQADLGFGSPPSEATISEATLENTASGSNAQIVLEATGNIAMEDLTDDALTLSDGVSLVLRTRNNPAFEENPDGGITMNQADSIVASGGGGITLQAGYDGQSFVANSVANVVAGSLVTDGGPVTVQATGDVLVRSVTTAGAANRAGGNIVLEAGRLTASHTLAIDQGIDSHGGLDADASGANAAGSVTLSGGSVYVSGDVIATGGDDNGDDAPGAPGGSVTIGAPSDINSQASSIRTSGGDGSSEGDGDGGDVIFNGPLVLIGNTTITSGNGDVTFEGTIDDYSSGTNPDLVVNSGGLTRFNGEVGGQNPISSLTTDAAGTTEIAADITTGGALPQTQIYNDPVVLTNDVTLTDYGTTGIFFNNTVDDDGISETGSGLAVNTAGTTRFGGVVGGIHPIDGITTAEGGMTEINANITTGGTQPRTQIYYDPVILTNSVTLTDTGMDGVYFGSTIHGNGQEPWGLSVVTTNDQASIWFGDAVRLNGPIKADAVGNIYATELTSASNNIELHSTRGDLILRSNINADADGQGNGGGVSLIADSGTIQTGDGILNITITGYSDEGHGVDLPYGSGKTAIRIESAEPLVFGSGGALVARGTYAGTLEWFTPGIQESFGEWARDWPDSYGSTFYRSAADDRTAVGFSTEEYYGGVPIDVAIYARSSESNLTINSPVTVPDGATVVLDAYDTLSFGGTFTESSFPDTSRLEVVSRRTTSLATEADRSRFPYPVTYRGEGTVTENEGPQWFTGYASVLRGGAEARFLATMEHWYYYVPDYDYEYDYEIAGADYLDYDGDGLIDDEDTGLSGVTIFIDMDESGTLNEGDLVTTTGEGGAWSFYYVYHTEGEGGYYDPDVVGRWVFEVVPSGYVQTLGEDGYWIHGDGSQGGLDFANYLPPSEEETPLPPPLPVVVVPVVVPPIPIDAIEGPDWIRSAETIIGVIVPPHPECVDLKEDDIDILRKCQVACDLFSTDVSLNVVAEDLVSLHNKLIARVYEMIPRLDSLSQKWSQPGPGDIQAIEEALRQDVVLSDWLHDAVRFVKLMRTKLGKTTEESSARFVQVYLAENADVFTRHFVRAYLESQLELMAEGSKPVAQAIR